MITPQLRFQECETAGHTKSGAGTGDADRTGSGSMVQRDYYKRFIEAEV